MTDKSPSKKEQSTGRSTGIKEITSNKNNKYVKKSSLSDIVEEELGDLIKKKSKLHQLTFKLTTEYRDAVAELAKDRDQPVSEVTRRALFAVLDNPELLDQVEDTEQAYRQSLGPSRHHK